MAWVGRGPVVGRNRDAHRLVSHRGGPYSNRAMPPGTSAAGWV